MSFARGAYRLVTTLLHPFIPGHLAARAKRGKDDPARLNERTATALPERGEGVLIWLHGASMGESLVNLTLAEALARDRDDLRFLFTSHTLTSAGMVARRVKAGVLAGRARHGMAPVDTPIIAKRFIAHWRPDLGVFAEGEIWPNLIASAQAAGTPLALVNARMTASSLAGWGRVRGFAREVFGAFAVRLVSDAATRDGLAALTGLAVTLTGNLKGAAEPPGADEGVLADLRTQIGDRPVWLAASTHEGEETLALAAHGRVREAYPGALLILAPRHPERGDAVEAQVRAGGFTLARRSRGEMPGEGVGVYLADTLGEMGLWVRLSAGVYLGGGHAQGLGGHNPIEIVRLRRPVASGPIVFNFAEVFAQLQALGAVGIVADADALTEAVRGWLSGTQAMPDLSDWEAGLRAPLEMTLAALKPLLPTARGRGGEAGHA
jgi:3-deoxy-D-manno-octulosonic-acid transferase